MKIQKVLVRCDRAGVFFGELVKREGSEAVLKDARRIYYWTGAATLSQIAMNGVASGSKLTMPVPEITVLGVIEVIPITEYAQARLDAHPEWRL